MIPETNITAWSLTAPWAEPRQVEQDLIISRALVEIFNHDLLGPVDTHDAATTPATR